MGLGSLTLADAREKAYEARKLVGNGTDPIEARKAKKAADRANERKTATFEECVKLYLDQHRASWKTPGYERDWKNSMAKYVFPHIKIPSWPRPPMCRPARPRRRRVTRTGPCAEITAIWSRISAA
jgi:hypothetical protein